jgi:L-rhamnose mutarotase
MERIGHMWRVKRGMADEYARRHREIWPELDQLLRDGGVEEYTIYLSGETVFSHMEVEDYDEFVRGVAGHPVLERWEALFADLVEYPDSDPQTGWPARLHRVWSL